MEISHKLLIPFAYMEHSQNEGLFLGTYIQILLEKADASAEDPTASK